MPHKKQKITTQDIIKMHKSINRDIEHSFCTGNRLYSKPYKNKKKYSRAQNKKIIRDTLNNL